MQSELQRTADAYRAIDADDREASLESVAAYLSHRHASRPEQGCFLPSLTPEVARADRTVRSAFQEGVLEIHSAVARLTGSSDKAWALVAQNVGALMIARAMLDEKAQRELLAAARRQGQALLSER